MRRYALGMSLRAFLVIYAQKVEVEAKFWERLGFQRHFQLPAEGEPGYVGLSRDGSGELAITHPQWASERYGLPVGDGARFEMYVYVDDLTATFGQFVEAGVTVLLEPEDMPWGERIATVTDPEGNPVALCQKT